MGTIYRYFINDRDQIKMISDPEQDFQFRINTNDRYNELQAEAMNSELLALPALHTFQNLGQLIVLGNTSLCP